MSECTPLAPCHSDGCRFCDPAGYMDKPLGYAGDDKPEHDPTADLMREVYTQRLRREARRRLDAEERPPAAMPEVLTLWERLARPREPVPYRIDGWQPAGSRVMLAAQYKAGKTTLVGNLVRSLVDGDPFLDRHTVTRVAGPVVVLDFEMGNQQLDSWLDDQKIRADDQVVPIPMRGNAAAFDILDPAGLARWVTLLRDRDTSYLVLDCLRPVLDALGLDEQREAGRFLVALDTLLKAAGIGEAAVVHHMGHAAERSRGDSRIRDWPDVEWRLVREGDDPAGPRYLSAYGRDVEQPEALLSYDPTSRHLTLLGGNRKAAAARAALRDVLDLLTTQPGLSANAVEVALIEETEHGQKAIREAVKLGVREQIITKEKAAGRRGYAYCRTLNVTESVSPSESVTTSDGLPFESVSPSIGTDNGLTPWQAESPSVEAGPS